MHGVIFETRFGLLFDAITYEHPFLVCIILVVLCDIFLYKLTGSWVAYAVHSKRVPRICGSYDSGGWRGRHHPSSATFSIHSREIILLVQDKGTFSPNTGF